MPELHPQAKCLKCEKYMSADKFLTPFMIDKYCRECAKSMSYKEIKKFILPYSDKR